MTPPGSRVADDFDRIARLVAGEPERPDRYEAFVLAQIPPGRSRVLEVGCGAGRLARAIAARGATVTAIDASHEMIRLARSRTAPDARIDFVLADFLTWGVELESYDCVVSVATLHHLPAEPTLERMKGCLIPGGVLVIHDLRGPSGVGDWARSGVAALVNGDALWWMRARLRESHALRHAWHDHGTRERYPTIDEVREMHRTRLPDARVCWHPLWRYTVAWRKGSP